MKACILVISLTPCVFPMMPDKIGIIGNTHGVKPSNKPAPKKNETTSQKLPFLNSWVICASSDCSAAATGGLPDAVLAEASEVLALVLVSGRLICRAGVIGGVGNPSPL